jgi:hypothetical protein
MHGWCCTSGGGADAAAAAEAEVEGATAGAARCVAAGAGLAASLAAAGAVVTASTGASGSLGPVVLVLGAALRAAYQPSRDAGFSGAVGPSLKPVAVSFGCGLKQLSTDPFLYFVVPLSINGWHAWTTRHAAMKSQQHVVGACQYTCQVVNTLHASLRRFSLHAV